MHLSTLIIAGIVGQAFAHGDHGNRSQKPVVDENASWMVKHMAGK